MLSQLGILRPHHMMAGPGASAVVLCGGAGAHITLWRSLLRQFIACTRSTEPSGVGAPLQFPDCYVHALVECAVAKKYYLRIRLIALLIFSASYWSNKIPISLF